MKKIFALLLIFSFASCANLDPKKEKNIATQNVAVAEENKVETLFVQKGETASYRDGILMINRTSAHIFFVDKSRKISGHIRNEEFFKRWIESKKENPSATISFYRKNGTPEIALVTLSNPKIGKHRAITYNVKILSGKIPEIISEPALFIDSMTLDMGI